MNTMRRPKPTLEHQLSSRCEARPPGPGASCTGSAQTQLPHQNGRAVSRTRNGSPKAYNGRSSQIVQLLRDFEMAPAINLL